MKIYDMPGFNDAVKAKSAIAHKTARKCDMLLTVLPATRPASDSRTGQLVDEALSHVHFAGRVNRIVLVTTMSDKFNIAEEKRVIDGTEFLERDIG